MPCGREAVLFGGIAYFALNSFRGSLNNLHTVRTQLFRSPAFLIGGAVVTAAYAESIGASFAGDGVAAVKMVEEIIGRRAVAS